MTTQAHAQLPIGTVFESDLPHRLDRLNWSNWHWKIVIGLGITWLLDGLEVTLVGSIAGILKEPATLHLRDSQIGFAGSAYLAGAVAGALLFGRLTDSLGRKKLFLVTLSTYLLATLMTALSWSFLSFVAFRALTGMGVGGEYSAINSAIDELIPARVRGRVDLGINSSYWLGTALGASLSLVLLNPDWVSVALGWRLCFGLGAIIGCGILFLRHHLPESPRWLLHHGRVDEAKRVVEEIEREVSRSSKGKPAFSSPSSPIRLTVKGNITFKEIFETLAKKRPRRAMLGLALMIAQAFAYNAIFFTYALVLARYYSVPAGKVGLYILPFALGNFLGPILLGHWFDTWGRRAMISLTYGVAGALLAVTAYGFAQGWLTATSQTILWCAVFFVASAAASSAYLTVSEIFPVEMRGMAIALFYSAGTLVGGVGAPALLGWLIESGSRGEVAAGYALGAALLIGSALVALAYAVPAEGKSLEWIAEASDARANPARRSA